MNRPASYGTLFLDIIVSGGLQMLRLKVDDAVLVTGFLGAGLTQPALTAANWVSAPASSASTSPASGIFTCL